MAAKGPARKSIKSQRKVFFFFLFFFFLFLSPKFKSRKEYSLISLPHFLFQRSVEGARTSSAPTGSASRRSCDVTATTTVMTGATRPSAVCDRLRGFVRVGRDSSLRGARGGGARRLKHRTVKR